MSKKFIDIRNYINIDHDEWLYATTKILDTIHDKNIDQEELKAIQRSLILLIIILCIEINERSSMVYWSA